MQRITIHFDETVPELFLLRILPEGRIFQIFLLLLNSYSSFLFRFPSSASASALALLYAFILTRWKRLEERMQNTTPSRTLSLLLFSSLPPAVL
jgi:hypothetical protein